MTLITLDPTGDNRVYIIGMLTLIALSMLYLNGLIYKFYLLHLRIYIHSIPEGRGLQSAFDTTKFIPLNESEKELLNEIKVPTSFGLMRIVNFVFLCYIITYSLFNFFNGNNYTMTIGLNNLTFAYVFNFLMEFPKKMYDAIKIIMIMIFMLISFVNVVILGVFMIDFFGENQLIYFEYNQFLIFFELLFLVVMILLTMINSKQSLKHLEIESKIKQEDNYGSYFS